MVFKCTTCGGTDIEVKDWVKLNTGKCVDTQGTDQEESPYCCDCQEDCTVEQEDE